MEARASKLINQCLFDKRVKFVAFVGFEDNEFGLVVQQSG